MGTHQILSDSIFKIFEMKFGLVLFMLFAAASASKVYRITECKGQIFETQGQKKSDSDSDSKCFKVEPKPFTPVKCAAPVLMTKQDFLDAIAQCKKFRMSNLLIRE